jgi:hypothetical protein
VNLLHAKSLAAADTTCWLNGASKITGDKPADFSQSGSNRTGSLMAGTTEPTKQTVRIAIPPKPGSAAERNTVRIDLPARSPLPQRPIPPAPPSSGTTLMPPDSNVFASGPRKETARIGILPDPTPPIPARAPLPVEQPTASDIPMAFCWALLGLSAVILLIQIWAYFF